MRTFKLQPAATAFTRSVIHLQCALWAILLFASLPITLRAQQDKQSDPSQLTPLQLEIEKQRRRLESSETEERRDALMRLGAMKRPESSRVAVNTLRDSSAIVRATSARAILSLPADEAAALLLPLLQDRDEFVRQEAAYALGETRSRAPVAALVTILEKEKQDGVRGAATVALGQIGDEASVIPLTKLLGRRGKKDENEFVRRAAARSLGQIRSRAAVPALIAVVVDERVPEDVRREAANSLGLIGDPSAVPSLRALLDAPDPYLSRVAEEALRKITSTDAMRPINEPNLR
jgi:HEAT repeat protein